MNGPPLQHGDATRCLLRGQRLLVESPRLEELLPACDGQLPDVEVRAPDQLARRIVEVNEVALRIRDERRCRKLRRERAGHDQDEVRLLAFHRPILCRYPSD
jgi:hypothetical protein